jgi:stage V sporulation protein G
MDITEVKVTPVDQDQLKAYVTIVLDHCFVIRDVKVIRGPKGYFVAMPSKKRKDGTFRDIAHPINRETREKMEQKILEAYEGATGVNIGEIRMLNESGELDEDSSSREAPAE